MRTDFSVESIKNNLTKRHKSSTDIQTLVNKKSSTEKTNKNSNTENKDNNKDNIFICNHKSNFISFCEICSLDLCSECEEKHKNHKIIKFNEIIPNEEEVNKINNCIKKYMDDYNKLIEEIYKWKKELDKKIFYFEEQIKNNSLINKNIEYIQNFDFSKNNNYSSISKYKKISDMIIKPEKNNINYNIITINQNNDNDVGCYMYQNYMNAKQILDKLVEYKNDDFVFKSNEIVKLILTFLTINKLKNKNKYNEEINNLSPINNEMNENNKFFSIENFHNNNTYTFSNTCTKDNNINEININYFNNTIDNNKKNINQSHMHKIDNQSKSIGNIFLEEKKEMFNSEKNNNYIKLKKGIIKSSTLRRLNVINANNPNIYRTKDINVNQKKKNESNSVNYISTKLNKKISEQTLFNNKHNNEEILNTNNKDIIDKYIPKIKKQNRVYTLNNNLCNNLNTINSYNNINNENKNNVYRHKKLNSVCVSNYINQSLPTDFTNYNNNNDFDNIAQLNSSAGNYANLIKPINIDTIKNTYNPNRDRKNFVSFNSNMSPIYSLNTLDLNRTPNSIYSLKDTKTFIINNKRNEIKNKLLTKNSLTQNNYNTIIETPITFSSKISTENNSIKFNKSNSYFTEYNILQNNKELIHNENNNNNNHDKYLIDSNKNLYVGLELGNTECSIGIVNQNNYNNIELFDFDLENKENKNTIPTIISFDSKSNEIKIGNDAENNILDNPSQTIFNILKIIGKSYKQINNDIDLWPFKLYYNEDLCRPYVKINYNKQKNRIFFFEDLLSIYLKKLFEIFFTKIKLINSSNNIINLILVVAVPNNYNYLQRKIIEKIFQTQIFPVNKDINTTNNSLYESNITSPNNNMNKTKKKLNLYSGYKIILKDIKIENGSSIAALCLFNKIKFKNDIENINSEKNENNQNDNNINNKFKINIINNNYDEKIFNNTEYCSNTQKTKDNKGRESVNSNKSKNNNINTKNVLVINVDGGFTNISLANISQSKPKEKNNTKIKNTKNVKKNNINILEVKELSGNEYGEEDFIDTYINDCLKQFDENIYKECLKSPNELASLRQSVLIAKKYFNSLQGDNTISVSLPHKFLDLKIDLNKNDYEKSCQEIISKIISMIKSILKKSKLSEKNIDIIIIIGSKITSNKINFMLKNMFPNSKIICNNCNNYIVMGATMQALNNNMIKPLYKFIDITNMNFGIETLNGVMDIIVPKGLKMPVQKIKYVKIKNNENNNMENSNHLNKYLEINIFEGDNKFVKNNRLISCANIDKRNFKEEKIGEGYIELLVEFEINSYSCLSVYVLDIKNFKRRFECLTNLDMVKG